jgi:excisionase family DNA binding protein
MERLTYTIAEVAQLLGISRSKAYELVAEGLLPVVPLPGRRKLVARAVVERLVEPADRRLNPTPHRQTASAPSTSLMRPQAAQIDTSGLAPPEVAPLTA